MCTERDNKQVQDSCSDIDGEFKAAPERMNGIALVNSPFVLTLNGEFVFLLRCSEGTVGEIVHCDCLHHAMDRFGRDTFDDKKKYFDKITYLCIYVLLRAPAYICRVCREPMDPMQIVKWK